MNCAFSCKDLTMNSTSEEMMVLSDSQLTSFHSLLLLFQMPCISFSHRDSFECIYVYFSLDELVFVFVASL